MELTEARRLVLEPVRPKAVEQVGLEDALGRVLGETLTACCDLPAQSRSRLDGFALISGDTADARPGTPAALALRDGVAAAGHWGNRERMRPGGCVRILTGAPVPDGADAVVAQETVKQEGGKVFLERPSLTGEGITAAGKDIGRGEFLVTRGHVLGPTRLALIAALDFTHIPVYTRPRVALLATGDEVKEPGQVIPGPSTVCNNRLLLGWLVRLQGAVPLSLGVAGDDPEAIIARLEHVDADCVITTGGTGSGDRDFIREAWSALGVETRFRGVNLSPGGNSALGVKGDRIFFALSGNPWGARVAFEELVSPLLWKWQGLEPVEVPSIAASLAGGTVRKKKGFYRVVHGSLDLQTAPPSFVPAKPGKKSVFADMGDCLAYVLLEPDRTEVEMGDTVRVRFHDLSVLSLLHAGPGGTQC